MESIFNQNALPLFLLFAVPGIVMQYFRSIFVGGQRNNVSNNLIGAVVLSLLYQALLYTLIEDISCLNQNKIFWVLLIFIAPALIGSFLGWVAVSNWIKRQLNRLKINPLSANAMAWDWIFSRTDPCYVYITLEDGDIVRGRFASESLASSDPVDRDIFLERIYDKDESGGEWIETQGSIWLRASSIRSIEFLPGTKDNDDD